MNLLWYWMLAPARGGFEDKGGKAAFTQPINGPHGQKLEASLYVDDQGEPLFVRVRAIDADNIHDAERYLELVELAKEHMLSILRFSWHHDASYVPMSIFSQETEGGAGASVVVEWPSIHGFDPQQAHALFHNTFDHRESLRLLTDARDERVPIQYRFLSLYKFLELRYRGSDDLWDLAALSDACRPQLSAFDELKLKRPFVAELHHLRDRCAHIRSGNGKRRRLGVTALNPVALNEIRRMLPLLTEICRTIFNAELSGRVVFNDLRPWPERVLQPRAPTSHE
jgi:hypothetical protein